MADDPVDQALAEFQASLVVRPDMPPIMTTAQVASFLAVKPDTVRDYVHHGRLRAKYLRGEGSPLRFMAEDVLAFVEGLPAAMGCGCNGVLPDAGPFGVIDSPGL